MQVRFAQNHLHTPTHRCRGVSRAVRRRLNRIKYKTTRSIKTKNVRHRASHVAHYTSSKSSCRIVCFRIVRPDSQRWEWYPKRKNCIRLYQSPRSLLGHFWAFFRRSKPKKIQKSSEKHTLISFDSLLTTTNIVRSLRCFDVFSSIYVPWRRKYGV